MAHAQHKHAVTERRACRLACQPRGTQRYRPTQRADEDQLTRAIVLLAGQYGRYGYRRITALLVRAGWEVGKDRVERRCSSAKVIAALADVMVMKGVPEHLRSDNGPELVARDLRKWLADTGAKTAYIEHGSPWENGYCESFYLKMRDELLNGEIFYSMKELRVLAERWRKHCNSIRPHSSLGYRPPAPEAWLAATARQGEEPRAKRAISSNGRILLRSEPGDRCATLTIQLVQNNSQASETHGHFVY